MDSSFNEEEKIKELVLNEAELYLNGYSLREIAKIYNHSYITVRNNLTNRLKNYNINLWIEVQDMLNENKERNIRNVGVQKRVLTSLKYLIEQDLKIDEIANIMGVTVFTTYRDLTKRLKELNSIHPELVSDEMLENAASILNSHRLENLNKNNEKTSR